MRVYGTFTTVFKVWNDIATLPAVRDAVVNIFGQFMDIRLGNSDNRLIHALTERCHIKSGNVSIVHLRTYLTVEANREDDITIAHAFILFMMGHLWFQTANDTVSHGYLPAVNDLDSAVHYWGSVILASLYHGLDTTVTTGGAITGFVQLLPYWFCEYCRVGHPIVKKEVTGEVRIPLDYPLSILSHISPTALHEMRQAGFVDYEQFVLGEERETYASYWAEQTLEDFRLPGKVEDSDLGWYMEWTGRRERLPITHLRDPPPMSSFYGAEELWHLTHGPTAEEGALPPGGGARTRQRGSGPRTRGGSIRRRRRGTRDDSE
ncbi:hypothetical protein GIB67_040291 [Kingdonia uniflora]|uniref:Aminotransferase-like plant mobile domain-containing protein n=1 Tax=Kingdonia uniflora TaxID=39325 RepID=A0A7J7MVD5_9MAGN|nr:hypothetical protein GIB67_040291 [Kingdonia uniflora]